MAEKTAETDNVEALRAEMRQLRADMTAIATTLKALGTEGGTAAYEQVRQSAEHVLSEAEGAASAVARKVEERPLTTVLGAFVVGLILGALFSRR